MMAEMNVRKLLNQRPARAMMRRLTNCLRMEIVPLTLISLRPTFDTGTRPPHLPVLVPGMMNQFQHLVPHLVLPPLSPVVVQATHLPLPLEPMSLNPLIMLQPLREGVLVDLLLKTP
jgi:hypothetical protein